VCACTEILYGSLMSVGLVPANYTTIGDNDATTTGRVVLRRHPGFTADSIGYNAETGQYVYVYLLMI